MLPYRFRCTGMPVNAQAVTVNGHLPAQVLPLPLSPLRRWSVPSHLDYSKCSAPSAWCLVQPIKVIIVDVVCYIFLVKWRSGVWQTTIFVRLASKMAAPPLVLCLPQVVQISFWACKVLLCLQNRAGQDSVGYWVIIATYCAHFVLKF